MDEDRAFYDAELAPILPPVILDFHAHVWDCRDWDAVPWDAGAPGRPGGEHRQLRRGTGGRASGEAGRVRRGLRRALRARWKPDRLRLVRGRRCVGDHATRRDIFPADSEKIVRTLSRIRTDLDSFSDREAFSGRRTAGTRTGPEGPSPRGARSSARRSTTPGTTSP